MSRAKPLGVYGLRSDLCTAFVILRGTFTYSNSGAIDVEIRSLRQSIVTWEYDADGNNRGSGYGNGSAGRHF